MSLFIPTKIKVGYQKRNDTYTKKLAYVIYYDTRGKLRKETSWNSWRDASLPIDDYDNSPISGFKINRNVGETRSHWDVRRAYIRVLDPRGFEVEISLANFIHILEHCNCNEKELSGEFVYAWDDTELVLLSSNSPDYKELKQKTETLLEDKYLRGTDLIVGHTYATIDGDEYVYLGKFPEWKYNVSLYSFPFKIDACEYKYEEKDKVPKSYQTKPKFWFKELKYGSIFPMSSITRKFYSCTSKKVHPKLDEFKEKLSTMEEFAGVDFDALEYHMWSRDAFKEYVERVKSSWRGIVFGTNYFAKSQPVEMTFSRVASNAKLPEYKCSRIEFLADNETGYGWGDCLDVDTIYDTYKPYYIQSYLLNGKEFRKYLIN